jgi:hypothetical protein
MLFRNVLNSLLNFVPESQMINKEHLFRFNNRYRDNQTPKPRQPANNIENSADSTLYK